MFSVKAAVWVVSHSLPQGQPRQTGAGQSRRLISQARLESLSERQRRAHKYTSGRSVFVRPAGLLPGLPALIL